MLNSNMLSASSTIIAAALYRNHLFSFEKPQSYSFIIFTLFPNYIGGHYSRTPNYYQYYSGAQLWYQQIFAPLLNFYFLCTFSPAKNTGTYYSKNPANPHKLKVSSTASIQSPHALKLYFALTFAHAVLDFHPLFSRWQYGSLDHSSLRKHHKSISFQFPEDYLIPNC